MQNGNDLVGVPYLPKKVYIMIKAVIFDMDGLILDTEKLLVKYWCQAANEAGFPMQREFGKDFDYVSIRSRRMELMSQALERDGLQLKKGIRELLEYLKQSGIPSAVATATDYERAKAYLTRVGIFDSFDKIVCATMVESGKPAPDIYLYAAEQLGLPPCECMALEDSPNGVRSASAAGCVTVMVPDLTQPDEELSRLIFAKADSLLDVPEIIQKT